MATEKLTIRFQAYVEISIFLRIECGLGIITVYMGPTKAVEVTE